MPEQDLARATHDVEAVIYGCLLNEVFLLLDYVSGRSDRTLVDLDGIVDPARPDEAMKSAQVLAVLNHIRYPPVPSANDRARDATVLLQAKDRLNSIARPATGLSVAYTTMFAGGVQVGGGVLAGVAQRMRRGATLGWLFADAAPGPATRATMAVNAYPSLVTSARRFRLVVFVLVFGALVVTALSVWVSYEVALGKSLLLRLDALDRQQAELSTRVYAAEQGAAPRGADAAPRLCTGALRSVEQQQLCDAYADWMQKNALAYRDLRNYARLPAIRLLTPHGPPDGPAPDATSEQLAASVLGAFSTAVLPVQFGLLGTAAAVVRGIYGHVRRRTLTPRQLNLALIQLPLGLVAGVSVGLFFSPDVAPVQGATGGLAAGLALSASGIAFLAGYGVEAVFRLFDALLNRLFTATPSEQPDAPNPAPDPPRPALPGARTA